MQLLVSSDAQRALHALGAIYGVWSARPPRGVTVFAERCGETGAAQPQKRRHHCTPSRACRFALRGCTFPPPARRHVGCGGRRSCGAACSAGNRRAGALVHGPRCAVARFPPALGVSRPLRRARKGMRACARATVAPRRHARPVARASRARAFPPPNLVHVRLSPVAAPKARLKLSWPAAAWLRAFPRARAA
jgi:hypothetical protein